MHAVDTLQHMYCVLNMSNYQFVQKYNWPNKYFTGFLEALGITRKSKKDSLKNYARICGKEITDEKKYIGKHANSLLVPILINA